MMMIYKCDVIVFNVLGQHAAECMWWW